MNGRIYDPLLGRFLSADILVQAPGNLQSYNRYSYVFNNPLSMTDPSGFTAEEDANKKQQEEAWKKLAYKGIVGIKFNKKTGEITGLIVKVGAARAQGQGAALHPDRDSASSVDSKGDDGKIRAQDSVRAEDTAASPSASSSNGKSAGSDAPKSTGVVSLTPKEIQLSVGVGATAAILVGAHGEVNVGLNIPSLNPLDWSLTVSAKGGPMAGLGFAGTRGGQWGVAISNQRSTEGLGTAVSLYGEAAAGLEEVAGISGDLSLSNGPNGDPCITPSLGSGKAMRGGGAALWIGAGLMYAKSYTTPTFGQMLRQTLDSHPALNPFR